MYTDEEMVDEIREYIEEIGGAVAHVPGNLTGKGGGLQLYIEPQLLDQARLIVEDVRLKYKTKREEMRIENPFIGVEQLLDILE